MSYRRDDGGFLFLTGCLIPVVVIWVRMGIALSEANGGASWLLYIVGTAVVVVGGPALFSHVERNRERRKKERLLCPHGLLSGVISFSCEECESEKVNACADEQREEAERRRRAAERAKEKEYADTASRHAELELERLWTANIRNIEHLRGMAPFAFESLVCAMYRSFGYAVEQTKQSSDRGKDGVMHKDGKKYLIECKRYSETNKVGRPALQKFFAALHEENAAGGFFVTTGEFAMTAPAYAQANGIELISGHDLPSMMRRAFPGDSDITHYSLLCLQCNDRVTFPHPDNEQACANGHSVHDVLAKKLAGPEFLAKFSPLPGDEQRCSECGKKMRVRNGRRGKFWGCTDYPQCRFTKDY